MSANRAVRCGRSISEHRSLSISPPRHTRHGHQPCGGNGRLPDLVPRSTAPYRAFGNHHRPAVAGVGPRPNAVVHGVVRIGPSSATVRPATPRPPSTTERSVLGLVNASRLAGGEVAHKALDIIAFNRLHRHPAEQRDDVAPIRPRSEISVDSSFGHFRGVSSRPASLRKTRSAR